MILGGDAPGPDSIEQKSWGSGGLGTLGTESANSGSSGDKPEAGAGWQGLTGTAIILIRLTARS